MARKCILRELRLRRADYRADDKEKERHDRGRSDERDLRGWHQRSAGANQRRPRTRAFELRATRARGTLVSKEGSRNRAGGDECYSRQRGRSRAIELSVR